MTVGIISGATTDFRATGALSDAILVDARDDFGMTLGMIST